MSAEERVPLLLVCWRKSYGAVTDESLKAAVAPNVPHPAVAAARRSCHSSAVARVLFYQSAFVGVAGKPVGKPDALVGHVPLDERGSETTCCPQGPGLAPFLDSTGCPLLTLWIDHVRL